MRLDTPERKRAHRRNPELEQVLEQLNRALAPAGDARAAEYDLPRHPVVLVVGCPRSGTTLLMQWLAAAGCFSVPSNLVARFFRAPAIGALVERVLFDPVLDFRGELRMDAGDADFESSLGKTRGPLQPSEFWYFWRRFFPPGQTARIDEAALARVDGARFVRELAAWEAVRDHPLALKAMLLDWHLPLLAGLLERSLFLDVVREPFFNIQSLLAARREFFGDETQWYSLKPPEYGRLRTLDPVRQVAGQVRATRHAIDGGLAAIPADRRVRVDYERFCERPVETWTRLRQAISRLGHELPVEPPGPTRFDVHDHVHVDQRRADEIRTAWSDVAAT